MDAASIVILGVMGPMLLLCIIGIPIVLHINKKERQAEEEEEEEEDVANEVGEANLFNKTTVIPPQ
jgi:hypothetical protein